MNIDHLRYFLVLTQEMHYGRAAQRLNISQSGLSHAMAALEQELGAPLFKKRPGHRPGALWCRPLLPQAQQIVTLADNCLRSFQMLREGIGTLRIQTIPLLLVPWSPACAAGSKQRTPAG
ncbi:MAG: LysR family transcriptional regulator [Evtepia sp.]